MEITPLAVLKLKEFAEDFEAPYVRIGQITSGGACCAKVQLGVSLDDSIQENDKQTDVDGLIILMDADFHRNNADRIKVDFIEGQGITVELTGACPKGNA